MKPKGKRILKDPEHVKSRHFSIRMRQEQYDKIRACALREDVPVASLLVNLAVDYADKDVDMTRQMMASVSRLHADIKKLIDTQTLNYNLLYSYIYMFLFAFAKECSYEFATEEYTSDEQLLAKGLAQKGKADSVMELFNRKFLSDDAVRRCVLANLAGMKNPEAGAGDEEEQS